MTTTRKYYALIPSELSHDSEPYWLELLDVKTLTASQFYVDKFLCGLREPEIGVSINGAGANVVSKKNTSGKWQIITKENQASPYANDQIQYHLGGTLVSKEDFFKHGFSRERAEESSFSAIYNTDK